MIAAHSAVVLASMMLVFPVRASAAAERTVAVFDFELIDTSLEGERNGQRADEQQRLSMISDDLRARLADSPAVRVVDTAAVDASAHASTLHACGGCDTMLAAKVGAALSITGTVQKVSNLILNMNIYVRDVSSGRLTAAMSADMRGNTDESWSRTLAWLVRNRLRPALDGVP
jgi:hypothetical protein